MAYEAPRVAEKILATGDSLQTESQFSSGMEFLVGCSCSSR